MSEWFNTGNHISRSSGSINKNVIKIISRKIKYGSRSHIIMLWVSNTPINSHRSNACRGQEPEF